MERSSADISSSVSATEKNNNVLNLKETELRLGLPGSVSPERKPVSEVARGYSPLKNFLLGAKRGFFDATDNSGQWAFSGSGGSEVADLVRGPVLYSPRDGNCGSDDKNNSIKSCFKPGEENKTSATNENAAYTPSK